MSVENLIEFLVTGFFIVIVLFVAMFLFAMFLGWGYYCFDHFLFSQINF